MSVSTKKDRIGYWLARRFLPALATVTSDGKVSQIVLDDSPHGMGHVRSMLARQIAVVLQESPDLMVVRVGDADRQTGLAPCATELVVMTPEQVCDLCRQAYEAGRRGDSPYPHNVTGAAL